MSKLILRFNLPEEKEESELAQAAERMHFALNDIRQEIFRPARKHGYSNPKLMEIINKNPELTTELIWELETMFTRILNENNIPGDV